MEPDVVIGEHVVFIKQHEDIDHALKVVPSCQLPILDILLRSVHVAQLIPIGINSPTGFGLAGNILMVISVSAPMN